MTTSPMFDNTPPARDPIDPAFAAALLKLLRGY